jgi:hypothetical protein
MNLLKKIKNHLEENNMTYMEHLKFASYYGMLCILHGLGLVIHSIFPCFFIKSGTNLKNKLAENFNNRM